MRRLLATALLSFGAILGSLILPGAARAASNLPQMDFSNPLNLSQVVWLVIILVALYFILANWALPGVGSVLADRAHRIQVDLDAAHRAKAEADNAIAELQAAIKSARGEAQAEVTKAAERAKAEAARQAEALAHKLDEQLVKAEADIASARTEAMKAIRPIATETAGLLVARLTGRAADQGRLGSEIQDAMATRGLA
ncbi:F0F1 ATP synthase subunit B [Acidisoma sp.]|uniref:F0F1 ATP synthase subunit B family protein n=1 Tax=Acidisoma sp. TaxID=1872115 RepID=UPI003AFFBA59